MPCRLSSVTLRFLPQLPGQFGGDLITEGVGDNDKHPRPGVLHAVTVKVFLQRNADDMPSLRQILGADIRPVLGQPTHKPVCIQPLDLIGHMLKRIIQQFTARRQALPKGAVEQAVLAVHLVVIGGVLAPELFRLGGVEARRVV